MRKFLYALVAGALLSAPVTADAAACRDAKGKFIKCAKAAPVKAAKCRDAKGHFTKCPKT
ncbi:hypothetical protein ACFO0A_12650 [Novosphingobium tardum]|uniref:Uncharacterized protein n=1 Tax=Novosphingobium tardum TaxID=1538021 RepID=A0ABV8RS03_9SPHN